MGFLRSLLTAFLPGLVLVLLFSACIPGKGMSISLEGTSWKLMSLAGEEVLPDTFISAAFGEDGSIGGSSGCNSYSAQYEVDGNKIKIGPSMGTLMACPEPVMAQESAYLNALGQAERFKVDGQNLVLLYGEGGTLLVFAPQEQVSLEGTEWDVISYNNGKGGVVSVISGTEITAEFGEEGTLTGSAGCNNYNAEYEVDGENINIGPAASTRKFCSEPEGIMEQEGQYLAALESAATYQIENDRLDMYTGEGSRVGTFSRVP